MNKTEKVRFQGILGDLRRADERFCLIADGDKIAVGVSGGKDSLLLTRALAAYREFGIKQFAIVAITVDCTGGAADYSRVGAFCEELGVKYVLVPSQIFEIIFNVRKEKNPCSLCSKLRRGMLNSAAVAQGCNKVALGHHSDDLTETFLLSMLYEGRLSTFMPKSFLDKTNLVLIRPFVFVAESDIVSFAKNLPVVVNPCPANHNTQREYMKKLVAKLSSEIPDARERMVAAITSPERYNLYDKSFDEVYKKKHN